MCIFRIKKKSTTDSGQVADMLNRPEPMFIFAVHDPRIVNSQNTAFHRKLLLVCNFDQNDVMNMAKTHIDASRRDLSESAIRKLIVRLIRELAAKNLNFRNGTRQVF